MPTGCFSLLALFFAFVVSIALIVFSAMKSTDVYKDALARAQANSAVIEALGSPIKEGFLVSGNTNVNGAAGEANLSIPISGPKGKGTIYVAATNLLAGGTIRASSWRSQRRINGSTFSRIPFQQIRSD